MSIFPAVRAAAICSIRPTSTPTFDLLPRRPRFRRHDGADYNLLPSGRFEEQLIRRN